MKKTQLILLVLLFPILQLTANTFEVGAGLAFETPNELYLASESGAAAIADGDTINIAAQTYTGGEALAVWRADNLLIRGVGGMPHLRAGGQYIWGKGIWVVAGNNCRVESIEFSEASVPDQNGAGIRLDGIGLHVNGCYFHHNENGILTGNQYAGEVLVEHSEFYHNGYGDGYSHNIYIGHISAFTLRYCHMHHAYIGHNVKTRALSNTIVYNRISDDADGQSSRLLDMPNGGLSIVMGNVFMQSATAENNALLSYGTEGYDAGTNRLYVVNNTFVNERFNGTLINLIGGGEGYEFYNNLIVNVPTISSGAAPTVFAANLQLATPDEAMFEDYAGFDYHLAAGSPAIDQGIVPGSTSGLGLTPTLEYQHPLGFSERGVSGSIDIGAFEFAEPIGVRLPSPPKLRLHPNPAANWLQVDFGQGFHPKRLEVFDISGKMLESNVINGTQAVLPLTRFGAGVYFLKITGENAVVTGRFEVAR